MSECFFCVIVFACSADPFKMYRSLLRSAMSLMFPLQSRTDAWFGPNMSRWPLSTILVTDSRLVLKSGTWYSLDEFF